MSDIESRARSLFLEALDQQPEQIAGFLDTACADDDELRQRVETLLEAHQKAGNFLAPSHVEQTFIGESADDEHGDLPETTDSISKSQAGTNIGPYKLLQEIGKGGMGSVWLAKQSEPIKRKVAIKLIKAGMDSRQVLARFEAERQALAMMDHPNIARVLDGGMTDQGRPYFAMEYVKGVPLTEYCDEAKLSVKERLELFLPICHAVQHAHQKGIIHRDLKPSNILICLYDGKPVPKVIDFGLAKAMHHSLTEQSLYTAHGMMVGTPLYMSPEQAEHNNLDIDTRTDIYALGVILYELLTGSTPLEKAQMKEAAYAEVLRMIKESEPPKPSTRLSGSASLPSVAAQRSIEPGHLTRSITGDLDWVVMKALEKERSRRYETANGLAEDIRRHLSDEPVSAGPPSARYRMRKFIKRNRAGVIAASAIAVALLLGVAGTTSGMLWALSEKREAVAAREAERTAKQDAEESARLARDEADRATAAEQKTAETLKEVVAERDAKELARNEAEQISEFLTNVFQSPNPERDGREIKVVELLDNAAEELETGLADQPAQRAKLQATLGSTYFALGLYQQAIRLQEKVRDYHLATSGLDHLDTLNAVAFLATCYEAAARAKEALELRETVLPLVRKLLGPEGAGTAVAMNDLAISYSRAGRYDEAIKLTEEALAIKRKVHGPHDRSTLQGMHNLAIYYEQAGHLDEALKLTEEVLTIRRKVLGPEDPDTLKSMNNLAAFYLDRAGRPDEALELFEELLPLSRKVFGPEHPHSVTQMLSLANAYRWKNRLDDAGKLIEEALVLSRKVLGPEHRTTLGAMANLALNHYRAGRLDESLTLHQECLALSRKVLGPGDPETLRTLRNLTAIYRESDRADEAVQFVEELLRLDHKMLGPEHPATLAAMEVLAYCYSKLGFELEPTGRVEEAIDAWRKAIELKPDINTNAPFYLGVLLEESGNEGEAFTAYLTAIRNGRMWSEALEKTQNILKDPKNLDACVQAMKSKPELTEVAFKTLAVPDRTGAAIPLPVEFLAELLALRPDDSGAHNSAAWRLVTIPDQDGDYPQAELATVWARRACELSPDTGSLLNTLGVAQYRNGEWSAAIKSLARSIQLGEDGPYNWLFLAMAHHQFGQSDEAAEWYEKSLVWNKDNAAELMNDTELQGFYAEAAELLAPANDKGKSESEESSASE